MKITSTYHPSVLVDYKPNTVCINCGSDKGTKFLECDYWQDENYETHGEPHEWNKEIIKIPTFSYTKKVTNNADHNNLTR